LRARLSVPSIWATSAWAASRRASGGKIILPKTGDDENGYVAFFLDTEGNRVGLQSMG
jgi:predicted enzyme related to lactoylglutathione lyase